MSELRISTKRFVRVWVDDVAVDVKKPNNGELLAFESSVAEATDSKAKSEVVIGFYESLGLSRELFMQLDPETVEQITQAITPAKKK